jgi:hypothetical protein
VVEVLEMRDLVGNDVAAHFGRSEDEAPAEPDLPFR